MTLFNSLISRRLPHYVDGSGGEAEDVVEAIDEGVINQEVPTEEAQATLKEEQEPLPAASVDPEGARTCCSERSLASHPSPG